MMKAAVIENGVVTHLWEVPALDCYGDLYVLVEAADWVKLGATWDGKQFINPAEVPATAPTVVTMRQARLALLEAGLLTQVNMAIANMPGTAGDAARIEWEFSGSVDRSSPLVQSLIGALDFTESNLDDLFRLAATL